jgi:glycosyltransferase involved in cell wall biosynthesis
MLCNMRVSFIIPHKGREEMLKQTILSILALDAAEHISLEIIVVTQNAVLECPYAEQPNVRHTIIFRPGHETISALRNAGVKNATGDFLAFIDADIQLSANWLNTMLKELNAKAERVLVSAIQTCGPDAGIAEKARVALNNAGADQDVEFLGTANLFLPRDIFERTGGFPEDMVTCEDYYFTNKVHHMGELYVTSGASFIHLGEDKNLTELFRKEIWRGQANLQSIKARKLTMQELPSLLTPLGQAVFLIAAIIMLFTGHPAIALICAVLVVLPIFPYALRLYRAGKKTLAFSECFRFYAVYQGARIIGTVFGRFVRL